MSELQQYIDIYREHRGDIELHSAEPLNNLRQEALMKLDLERLPRHGSENYENIDIPSMLATDYGININRVHIDVDTRLTFQCDVPLLTTRPAVIVNDIPIDTDLKLPEGVEFCSLKKYAKENPGFIEEYYGKQGDLSNPLTALNTLLAQDGFVLHVRKGVKIEKSLQLINILSAGAPLMAVRRGLIIIDEDAEASLLVCDHTQCIGFDMAALETIEIFVGKNARFNYYNLEESTENTRRISTLYLQQAENSRVTVSGLTLYNGQTRNEYYCNLKGEQAELQLSGMGIEDQQRNLSTYARVDHTVGRCKSNQIFKYTLDDEAKGSFTGLVYVAPGAVKTEAYQSNRNLVGTERARMMSKPQLEIYNDDVKCSHGSATGQLDALQLFYMRTRGLSEATARLLLKQAFMADVLDTVTIPVLHERLNHLVENRYAGCDNACARCAGCK